MELSCQRKIQSIGIIQGPKTWAQTFETEPIAAANLQTGMRRDGRELLIIYTWPSLLAATHSSSSLLAPASGRRPRTERRHWIGWDYSKENVKSLTTCIIELVRQTQILACASTYWGQSPSVPRNRVFFKAAKQLISRHHQHMPRRLLGPH